MGERRSGLPHLLAGLSAGVGTTMLLHPLDLIKIRLHGMCQYGSAGARYVLIAANLLTLLTGLQCKKYLMPLKGVHIQELWTPFVKSSELRVALPYTRSVALLKPRLTFIVVGCYTQYAGLS